MLHMTIFDVKQVTLSEFSPESVVPSSSTEHFSIFQLLVLVLQFRLSLQLF